MSHESCNTELAVRKEEEKLDCHLKWVLQIIFEWKFTSCKPHEQVVYVPISQCIAHE